jgi:hypothetical protein
MYILYQFISSICICSLCVWHFLHATSSPGTIVVVNRLSLGNLAHDQGKAAKSSCLSHAQMGWWLVLAGFVSKNKKK